MKGGVCICARLGGGTGKGRLQWASIPMGEGLVYGVCHGWVFSGLEGLKREVGGKQFTPEKNVNHFTKIRLVLFLIEDIFSVDQIFQGHS